MHVSLLERICARPVHGRQGDVRQCFTAARAQAYQRMTSGQYHPLLLCKLVRNYRSHPDIIAVPSRLFYECVRIAARLRRAPVNHLGDLNAATSCNATRRAWSANGCWCGRDCPIGTCP
jgi:hypothetical protein